MLKLDLSLRLRISQMDWVGDSSSTTLNTFHTASTKVIPPFARLAIAMVH